ncbi:serine/threonine-protein kinase [Simiduia aestuariiviva]|uniref:Serine/threonine-protein kinase n=1 Tax=Simiduia aestuariiviva TaxID=1510459 RepID=A0A839UT14_9GAMM|nr:serine/threonine-protein kinase [Simiduia aestuariiviva]MBB3169559.1 serine/threonine-protein kinase [Simiduia aestuariiviva]
MTYATNSQTDHYEIESILGKGGMGVVYLAYDKRLDRKIALKCIRKNRANPLWIEAVQEEAKLLAKINHTNIVQIYDLIEWQDSPALVMEYVEGRTLLDWLCSDELSDGRLSLNTRLDWLRQIADGLACAHEKGIIHRDLKPENIMISAGGQVKIMDFGIARHQAQPQAANVHDSQALPGEYIGSPAALSPEQAMGDNLTTASDIFSFGILAYSLLCKHHPFGDTQDPDGILQAILYRAPLPVSVDDDTSNSLDAFASLLIQCLDKDPAARPTACSCAKQLINATEPAVITAESTPPTPSKPDHTLWAYAVLVAVISLASLAWLTFDNHQANQILAIQEPVITINNTEGVAQTTQLRLAVDNALQESLLSQSHIQLVDRHEWQHTSSTKAIDINAITGAKHVVRPTIDCQANRCQIELLLIDAQASTIVSKQSWPVFLSNEADIYYTTWQHALALIGSQAQSPTAIDQTSYLKYIKILETFNVAAQLSDEEFQALTEIIETDASFIPAYRILTHAAVANLNFHNEGGQIRIAHELLNENKHHHIDESTAAELESLIFIALRQLKDAEASIQKVKEHGKLERHLQLTAKLASRDNDFEKAERIYSELLENRFSVALLYDLAAAQYFQGKYQKSIETLNTLINISPEHTPSNSLIAGLSIAIGDVNTAIEAYHRLTDKHPDSIEYNNLATAYMLAADFASAQKYQEKALEISPNNPTFYLNMGEIHLLNGNAQEAEYFFQEALKKLGKSDDIDTLVSIATANIHLGNLDEASKNIAAAKKLEGGYADLIYAETLFLLKSNKQQKAMDSIAQLLELGYTPIWFTLPWFTSLCTNANFQLLVEEAAANFCATANITTDARVDE